jgi:hypothetical protein
VSVSASIRNTKYMESQKTRIMSACSERVKTCQTCARAKIRCLRTPGETVCDR